MVLLQSLSSRTIDRGSRFHGRSIRLEITIRCCFLICLARCKEPTVSIIKCFQTSLDRRVVVEQATSVVVEKRRRRPYPSLGGGQIVATSVTWRCPGDM